MHMRPLLQQAISFYQKQKQSGVPVTERSGVVFSLFAEETPVLLWEETLKTTSKS